MKTVRKADEIEVLQFHPPPRACRAGAFPISALLPVDLSQGARRDE